MEELKNVLISKPHIKEVYFNDNGEWLFHPRPKFPTMMTREEILGEEKKEENPETKKKNDKKQRGSTGILEKE